MRTSRQWIDRAVTDLDLPGGETAEPGLPADESAGPERRPGRASDQLTFEITLSRAEAEALDLICLDDELSPRQALEQIVRARLAGKPQFGRADRARLRACLALLRALEQHVGRAARPVLSPGQSTVVIEALSRELLDLGAYLRRVGRAIGEAMLGNLEYWRHGSGPRPAELTPPELPTAATEPRCVAPPQAIRTGSSGSS